MSEARPVILFLCVHNAGRSQMAAAFARGLGGDRVEVLSAGSDPGAALNPAVVAAMSEVGLDIAGEQPKAITDAMAQRADVVVTMGCGDACPYYPGKRYLDWELTDPAGHDIATVRTVRDDIEVRVRSLMLELNIDLD
jgi:arsenate reductase